MPVLTKRVYEDGADAVGVLSVRFTLAGLALLGLALVRRERLPSGRGLATLALLGGVGYATQSLCYFSALERISAGLTALLLYFYPALVVLLSAAVLRVRPRATVVVCVIVATAGTALTVGPVGGPQATGVALGLGAALAYAVYIVLSSRALGERGVARGTGPFATSAVVMLACGIVYDVLALTRGARLPTEAAGWAALAGVALICTVVAVTTFFAALSRLGPADTSVLSTVEPVISVAAAAAVLGERLGGLQVAGGVLVLLAVGALARLDPTVQRDEDEVPA
ncbi:MAG: protein of unknown function transrane [Frankiales bacterium]|nr:protein of unknown function transrane [Frankiales bacterium]